MDNNELQLLRTKLKNGEYDGVDIMHAWMAIDELLEARANQGAAVAAERERQRKLVEQCRDALAEELSAWDIDPPLHHVKEAHDACVAWLLRA